MELDTNAFFREVTLRISSSLNVSEALESFHEYIKPHFPVVTTTLTYHKEDGFYLVASAGASFAPQLTLDPHRPMLFTNLLENELIERELAPFTLVVGSTRVLLPEGARRVMKIIQKRMPFFVPAFSSMLNTSLEIRGEVIGELGLMAGNGAVFTAEHAALSESVKEPFALAMSNARRYLELERLKEQLADDYREARRELVAASGDQVVGAECGLRGVMEMMRNVAPLNSPVLLLGETGTGKEVIANAIHQHSPRRDKPIVRVQCGAIPTSLLDSELFGHEKGAFTGAVSLKRGRFERADGGTLFLDEIGELPLEAQVKLLRVLQEKEIERLGGSETIHVDVRVIAATHRDLPKMVAEGTFREDLFFRLNVFPIFLPPLRDRKEDIPALTVHFINRKSREMGLSNSPLLTPEATQQLDRYDWPGNVRELQNVIERALITSRGRFLSFPFLAHPAPDEHAGPLSAENGFTPLETVTTRQMQAALLQAKGRIHGPGGAAALLGVNPSTLRYQLRKRGIPFGRRTR